MVASSTGCPSGASSARCRMNLVISGPGIPSVPVEKSVMVSAKKWPFPGTVLPIELDQYDASRMRILWDEVPTGRDRGAAAATDLAARMNGAVGSAGPTLGQSPAVFPVGLSVPAGTKVVSSSVTINGQQATPEQIAAFETIAGMDLDGDGVVGTPGRRPDGPA